MNPAQLKATIEAKTLVFETALLSQRPYQELQALYKELKELKYQLVQVEMKTSLMESTE